MNSVLRKVAEADQHFHKNDNEPHKTDNEPNQRTENIKKIIENNEPNLISFFQLFRYATKWEIFLLFVGGIFSVIRGSALPTEVIIYGEFTSMLVDRTYRIDTTSKTYLLPIMGGGKILTNASREENNAELYNDSLACGSLLTILTIILFISGIFAVDIFNYVALKQVTRIRIKYFTSIIRQDIGWHDITKNQNIAVKITDEIERIRDGISEKISHFMNLLIGFILATIIAFIYGWKLSLAISAYIPITFLTMFLISNYQSKLTIQELNCFARAGSLVEEILSGIRTVIAFGGEKIESKQYDDYLTEARKAVDRKGALTGFSSGTFSGIAFISIAGAFLYGINLVLADRDSDYKEYTPAILITVIFGLICGTTQVVRCSPLLESFATAKGSASTIFEVIDSSLNIDPLSDDGLIPNCDAKGDIDFQNVYFNYPSREDVSILKGINLKIESGKTIALVGSSGCGKSTCIQLLQRFYDPSFGQILLDNIDIRKYNISWLRSNIVAVGQEPVLFHGTIGENIKYGKPSATQNEIEEASKIAGAHNFIIHLPNNYATLIGERGAQLSGGQKQRIAIARALVQNPKILLLDEATSALDYKSEKLIQDAIDAASKNRTTIVVSHRLSAIKGADKIYFLDCGNVVEEGSPEDLIKLNGRYQQMVIGSQLKKPEKNYTIINRKISVVPHEQFGNFDAATVKSDDTELNKLSELNSQTNEKNEKRSNNLTTYWEAFTRILIIGKPVRAKMISAIILVFVFGAVYSTFSIFWGEFYAVLAEPDAEIALSKSRTLSYLLMAVGIVIALVCLTQKYLLISCGGWIATRIRFLTFKSILRQDVGWFDFKENSVGSLTARLSGDAANIQGAIGSPLSDILQGLSQFTLSVMIAMYFSRELTLIFLSIVPIVIGTNVIEAKLTTSTIIQEKKALEEASSFSTEAIHNIRTLAALRREKQIIEQFTQEMGRVEIFLKRKLRYRGLVNAFGNSFTFFWYSIVLSYGGILVSKEEILFHNVIKVAELLFYGSLAFTQSLISAPALTSALIAGKRLFEIIDHNPRITSPTLLKREVRKNQLTEVEYQGIKFNYSTRPEVPILQEISLKVEQGRTVALVGHSGCGKSTCIQLLQRFYDPDEGMIKLNQNNIKTELTLEYLRSELSIVSQEPVLFERTIAENIAYGDNKRTVSIAEIIEVSKQANAHSFITTLPLGYDTPLGAHGSQLSGGQKQRIAIARALIRNPKILLLDEATSALDIKSEKVVQSALDVACSNRTCIVIAHRLSTIQNADLICVLDHGKIVERGTHQQLLAKNGIYSELYNLNENINLLQK